MMCVINEKCGLCRDWLDGYCRGIDTPPGGCYVQPDMMTADDRAEVGRLCGEPAADQ